MASAAPYARPAQLIFACASTLRRSCAPRWFQHPHLYSEVLAPDQRFALKSGGVASQVLAIQSCGKMRSGANYSLHGLCGTATRLFCGCVATGTSYTGLGRVYHDCHHGCYWNPTGSGEGDARRRQNHPRGNCAYLLSQGLRSFRLTNFEFKLFELS